MHHSRSELQPECNAGACSDYSCRQGSVLTHQGLVVHNTTVCQGVCVSARAEQIPHSACTARPAGCLHHCILCTQTVVFVHRTLSEAGYKAVLLHGKRSQAEREAAVADFKAGKAQVSAAPELCLVYRVRHHICLSWI